MIETTVTSWKKHLLADRIVASVSSKVVVSEDRSPESSPMIAICPEVSIPGAFIRE